MSSGTGPGLNGRSTLWTVASRAPIHPQATLVARRPPSPKWVRGDPMKLGRAGFVGIALLVGWSGVAGASASSSAPITVRVALHPSRVVAGQPIKGTVVFTNTTSREIAVESCAANGWLQAGLEGRRVRPQPSSTVVACPPSIRLVPGANSIRSDRSYDLRRLCPTWREVGRICCLLVHRRVDLHCPGREVLPRLSSSWDFHMTEAPRPVTVTLLRPPEPKKSPRCPNCFSQPSFGPTPIRR